MKLYFRLGNFRQSDTEERTTSYGLEKAFEESVSDNLPSD